MRTPSPDIDELAVAAALRGHWGLDITSLTHAPVGAGGHHWWACTATPSNDRPGEYFVSVNRVDDGFDRLAAFRAARRLRDAGMEFVIAPVVTLDGAVMEALDAQHTISLTERVDGTTHEWGPFPDGTERREVLGVLARLHAAALDPSLPVDEFRLQGRAGLHDALQARHTRWTSGPYGERTRQLLGARTDRLTALLARYDELAELLVRRSEPFVVTHGEPHRANTISTAIGPVLVDWDTAMLAPPERDLWSIAVEEPAAIDHYVAATGTAVRPEAIELYRLRWGLTDIALYSDDLRQPHEESADTAAAWASLVRYCNAEW